MGRSPLKPWVIVFVGVLLAPATAFALKKPRPEDRVLPNFDSRFRGPRLAAALPEVESALQDLRRQRPRPVEARLHSLTGTVRLLSAAEGGLTPASSEPPETIARGFLRQHRDLFGLSEVEVTDLVKGREYRSRDLRLRHVRFDQSLDGIPVFEGALAVHLDDDGRVVLVSNNGVVDPDATPGARRAPLDPTLRAEDAIRIGLANIRPELAIEPSALGAATGQKRRARFGRGPLRRDITAELEYFPAQPRPRLAWRMLLEPEGFPQAYDILVDAESGEVLYRRNRVTYADGVGTVVQSNATHALDPRRPEQHPAGCPPIDGYATRDLTGPFRDPASVLGGTGRLSGNNVRAYRGFEGVFGALGSLEPDGVWHFEYAFNSASSAETQLFFASNFLHDFFYDLGFDEAAGNFQANNFGRGGVGGDPLFALARADGRNNATFEPQPEGTSPTMSMFLFDAIGCWSQDVDGDGAPDLDGDYDFDIVIHEFHHGVSWRLNPNFSGDEADAIGEGGSDFFAYSINNDTRLAEYVVPPDGIRQVNYKTYADWFCFDFFGFFFCEPHDNGEIWANVLWDLREQFRADLVGGSEASAINEAHQLYVDGLKLSPASPTMLDLRDAMLQADLLRNPSGAIGGSDNYCHMWWAFAGRGMGTLAHDTHDSGDGTTSADFTVPAACPAPPPKPTVTITASDDSAAEAGVATGAFTFTRTGDTSAALVVGYSIGGSATPGSDYVALSGTVTIPIGASEATVLVTPIDDTQVESDETVDVELQPSFNYLSGTPALASVVIVSEDIAPNLRVTLLAPAVGGAGDALVLTDTTFNPGTDSAPTSTTRFYLSSDVEIDGSDVLLGSRAVPPLAISAFSTGSTTVTLPAATATGEYFVIAQADADAVIEEISEDDNLGVAVVRIGPDLVVSAMTAPPLAGAGEATSVTETTRNLGGGAAAAGATKLYLSSNAVLDASDTLLGSRAVPALAPGASSSATTAVTIPAGTAPGGYFLIAYADGDAAVVETSETNNANIVFVVIGPDLVVQSLSGPAGASAGSSITVNDTTRNQGTGVAAASNTRFYLSVNAALDAADPLLGSRAVPPLAGGASNSEATSLSIPAGTAAGSYYVIAKADGDLAVPETQEGNNLALAALQVGADLVIPSVSAPPTAGAGQSINVSDTTRNAGGAEASASVTRFHLSLDAVLDATDSLIGSRSVPVLAAGASHSATTSVTIPAGTPPGLRWLIAQADGEGTLAETSELNNVNYVQLVIGPDLILSSLSAPAAAGAGASISVSDTTHNQGAGTAAASSTHFYLSTNASLDGTDTLLGSRALAALAGGASSSGTTSLTIPAAMAAGTYYVIGKADGGLAVAETQEGNNLALAAIQIGADLVVTSVTGPASAGAGAAISVGDTTRNQGGAAAAASATRFHLSLDAILDAADTLLGSRAVPSLGPGANSSGSTSVTIPAGTAPGSYYLIAQADGAGAVSETSETNNVNFVSLVLGPDLIVSSLSAPATAGAGTVITVTDTTRNQGAGLAAASTTKLYLSTNASVDGSDTLLGSRAVPALAAGVNSSAATSLTLPAGTAAGTYFILAQADADGVVAETTEGNNVGAASILIGPDLVVVSVTAPAAAAAGASITVNDTTRNIGAGTAAASSTRFHLSTNGTLDGGDTLLGSRAVPALASATSSSAATAVTLPAATPPGTYYVIAIADADGAVVETSEANNTSFATLVIGSDLVISSLTAPPTGGAGAALNVTDTTRNQGGAAAAASATRLYLSADPILDAGDTLLGARAVPALAAGASSPGTTSVTIPAGTPPGSRYILAQADGDGVVAETVEGNNVNYVAVSIGPDLVMQSLSGPAGAGAGTTITLNDTTRNQGGGAAAPSSTRLYLSVNAALDAGDTLLGSRAVPALAAATSSSGSTSVTIPLGTASGPYYLIAQADGDGAVSETSEGNNNSAAAILIGPDLVISSITAPGVAGAGVTLSVTETTRNQGGAAGASTTRIHFSTNAVLDAGDALLGARAVPALAAGATSTATTSVTIPAGTAPGYYYLIAQADGEGALLETGEINNINYVAILIGPDMLMQSFSGPPSSGPGSTITVNDTTRNQGGGQAAASTTRFYLSVNTVIDASDTLLGTRAVPELLPATNSAGSTSLTIPAGTTPGPYYLIAQADGALVVPETQEANNNALALISIGPDLIVPSMTTPPSAGAGATINITDTTRNSGGSDAAASVTRIYLSTNAVVDAGDVVLGARSVPVLAPGTTSTVTTMVTIPVGTPAGWYFVIVKADADGTLAEVQEANNVNYVLMHVFVP